MTETLYRSVIDSPVGLLTLVASAEGLRGLVWLQDHDLQRRLAGADPNQRDPTGVLDETARELDEYFAGERIEFEVPLDPVGTPFQLAAWMALRSIPYGETVSYGDQARRLGDVRKSRAVGAANGKNPISIIVPCHRVIGSDGSLVGFGGGLSTKAWLLDHERSRTQPRLL
jgi:methylated-DNA-[protein]-cysteine S-methyltransferase